MAKTKVMVIGGFCLGPGLGDAMPGDLVELELPRYIEESNIGRVRDLFPGELPPVDDPRADLLAQIAAAPDHESLELLLSEDPDIAAAYEARLVELDALSADTVPIKLSKSEVTE